MTKRRLLVLAHRAPVPPLTGEKMRLWRFLQGLAPDWEITLAAPVDRAEDWESRAALSGLGLAEILLGDLTKRSRAASGLKALNSGAPVSLEHFHDAGLSARIREAARKTPFDAVLLYGSGGARYLEALPDPRPPVILDMVDVDSAKWEDLAEKSAPPMGWVYAREARRLKRVEEALARSSAACLFATPAERDLFAKRGGAGNLLAVENGVDCDYWAAGKTMASPYPDDRIPRVIFTGAMDYPPNVEAAVWFAREILPRAKALAGPFEFVAAGARPAKEVLALQEMGVRVTGRVEDMRPWLAHAAAAVAPLRLARGVQNKLLEAMASRVPTVATPAALEGIQATPGADLLTSASASEFAAALARLLLDSRLSALLSANAFRAMRDRYDWSSRLEALEAALLQALAEPPDRKQDAA
ncbi:TIGR03087 family PEP-CTERM/XrtA system glycosyltransferase [Neomegalonema sp.]|uniref:TIGR03087 family PEP-CTERM/XrtA system glycosyltransferase n=1 Tax=Neomegalonema sp. TaxID=2039713 RepID=UPI00261FEBDB|nr:TIGR03087 family PEP-CTERM/XrtA system glycosyltransferase [Neomegalonema sp.]MDD2868130.1 TIGR03087 family PEP-CTERM/XrtA system glycosyltransferase [Neomegalonema sp.]